MYVAALICDAFMHQRTVLFSQFIGQINELLHHFKYINISLYREKSNTIVSFSSQYPHRIE